VTVLATIRPDDWNLPLLLHVLGAMILVGALVGATTALLVGWRSDAGPLTRLGFWTLLLVAFPSWWLMRIAAQWIYSKENFDEDPAWIGIGFITSELGGVLLLIAIVLTGLGMRSLRDPTRESSVLARIGAVLTSIMLALYVVAIFVMTTQPD
jgi:hypothetical protein